METSRVGRLFNRLIEEMNLEFGLAQIEGCWARYSRLTSLRTAKLVANAVADVGLVTSLLATARDLFTVKVVGTRGTVTALTLPDGDKVVVELLRQSKDGRLLQYLQFYAERVPAYDALVAKLRTIC